MGKQWDSMGASARRWGITYTCTVCSSESIKQSTKFPVGGAKWDVPRQAWVLDDYELTESYWCEDCHGVADVLIETVDMEEYKDGTSEES